MSDELTPEQQSRLNMIMSGYASQEEWKKAKRERSMSSERFQSGGLVVIGVSKQEFEEALKLDWGTIDVERWQWRSTADTRGWEIGVSELRNEFKPAEEPQPGLVKVSRERLRIEATDVINLVLAKNADYGDAWQALGTVGAAARFVDKLFRIERLVNGREALVMDEKLTDTVADMVGYGLLILLYKHWKEIDNP